MGAHIVRLDKPKNDPSKGTHGWQVRVGGDRGYHSKLFSDNVHGSRGKALIAAEEYLAEYLKEHPEWAGSNQEQYPHGFDEGGPRANNKSGVRGVYRTYAYGRWDAKKERKQYYWAAHYSIDREGRRRVRRHKRFLVDEYGEEEAKRRAVEFRSMWEEAALQGVEAVKKFFAAYEDGWLE
ncbi:MAG: hypothetical protein JXM69_09175 [Anaerolineae bacterium]|nr:hypothetical protein [Anaerolineae bacterium]